MNAKMLALVVFSTALSTFQATAVISPVSRSRRSACADQRSPEGAALALARRVDGIVVEDRNLGVFELHMETDDGTELEFIIDITPIYDESLSAVPYYRACVGY